MSKPSGTNSPTSSSVSSSIALRLESGSDIGVNEVSQEIEKWNTARWTSRSVPSCLFSETYCGGYSGEDPPLPIPNREVKLTIADGTAPPGGRVGSCHFYIQSPRHLTMSGIFCFYRSAKLIPPLAPSHFVGPTPYAGVRNANSGNQLRLTSLSTISELICM